jgi:hypothetical protein
VGVPGSYTYLDPNFGGLWTVAADAWTTAQIAFPSFLNTSGATIARTGFDDRNANGVGSARLVTSFLGQSSLTGTSPGLLGLAILNLTFVPEPSALGGAALALALLAAAAGARRRA